MNIVAKCPQCDAGLPVPAADAPQAITCGRCGRDIPLAVSDALRADKAVDRCPVCAGGDFYNRKDFIAYGILGGAALIDLIVYGRLKDLTVCYRCHSEFRGTYARTAGAFDLHTADVLEQEYERRIGRR